MAPRGRKKQPAPEDEKETVPLPVQMRVSNRVSTTTAPSVGSTSSRASASKAACKASASKARKPGVKKTTTTASKAKNTSKTANKSKTNHSCSCFCDPCVTDSDYDEEGCNRFCRISPYPSVDRFPDYACAFDSDFDDSDDCERCDDFFDEDSDDFFDSDDSDGIEGEFYRDNAFAVESYLRSYVQRPNISPSTRSRISDFVLFLHTLSPTQIPGAFILFCSGFADMDSLLNFPSSSSSDSHRLGMLDPDISRLPHHAYRGQTQKEKRMNEDPHKCCICMAELELGDELILLEKCSHRFHSGCLGAWLRRSNKCPICRATVNPPPLEIN